MRVGIYVRLSREDRNKIRKEDDSESIINQQALLIDYCKEHEWDVYDIYNDEDFSGSDKDRPDFNRMINDARDKKIDIVLCKTQSRFARDMETIEKYINTLFPIWGVRFLSVVDNADSENKATRKSRQINGLVDQWYLEDCSENIRAVLASKRKQGLWVGAFAPYGYKKDPNNKNHLIIDEEAAEVVKYVFDLYLQGYGITNIARILNSEKIPNPATYKKQHGQPFQNINGECSDMWQPFSIQRMLSNQIYIGNMVQGTSENISYKSNKKRQKSKDEWDIVEGTHEPTISKEVFDTVQELRKNRRTSQRDYHTYAKANVLATKVRCLKCGGSMRICYHNHKRYFRCNTCFVDKSRCTGTTVAETTLHKGILQQIKEVYTLYADESHLEKHISLQNNIQDKIEKLKEKMQKLNDEQTKIEKRITALYYDKVEGILSAKEFLSIKEECVKQQKDNETLIAMYQNEISQLLQKQSKNDSIKSIINEFKEIENLDLPTVQKLIDCVEVGGGRKDRIINIHWNF